MKSTKNDIHHELCARFYARDCNCGHDGSYHPNPDEYDLPGGNIYQCGTGANQYNRVLYRCEALGPGCSLEIDTAHYLRQDGAHDSMDIVRRFHVVNETPVGCGGTGKGQLKISGLEGFEMCGLIGPGKDTFTMSNSYDGYPAFKFKLENPGTKTVNFCFAVLGVRK